MLPLSVMVEAVMDDVANCVVLMLLEKVAVLATMLDIVKKPLGLVIAAELKRMELTCWAWIVL